jgi:hypothetical protein
MNELGAKLDGDRCVDGAHRPDSSSDTVTGLENCDIDALVVQRPRGSKSGCACSNHENVGGESWARHV